MEVDDEFESHYDGDACERKIAQLIKRAIGRGSQTRARGIRGLAVIIRRLSKDDRYLLVMVEPFRPRGAKGFGGRSQIICPRGPSPKASRFLEGQLQPELNQSAVWRRDGPGDMAGASRKDVEPRSIKMGLVEEIKKLRSELQIHRLG
jgi:hypothetical protein